MVSSAACVPTTCPPLLGRLSLPQPRPPDVTYWISRVQRVIFAVGKNLHQLEDLFVDVHDQAPQDVPAGAPELDFFQLQKLDCGFVKVLVEGSPRTPRQVTVMATRKAMTPAGRSRGPAALGPHDSRGQGSIQFR